MPNIQKFLQSIYCNQLLSKEKYRKSRKIGITKGFQDYQSQGKVFEPYK